MNRIDDVLHEFGHSIGIENFKFSPDNVATIFFESIGMLYIENYGDELFIYSAKQINRADEDFFKRALAINHYNHHPAQHLYISQWKNNHIIALFKIPAAAFDLVRLNKVISNLKKVHQEIEA